MPTRWILSSRLSELIGAIIGDGNIYGKGPHYVEMCGNPHSDFGYYKHTLLPIVGRELGMFPRMVERSKGLRFRMNCKAFVKWLKTLGLPAGEEKGHALIPMAIILTNRLVRRCLRGIFDTDGSIYFDMRRAYKRPYPRIELHMKNKKLLEQIYRLLREMDVPSILLLRRSAIQMIGIKRVLTFLREIGFSNQWHIKRLSRFYPELAKFNRP